MQRKDDGLKRDIDGLKGDVGELKKDVGVVKSDIGELKKDVGILKGDVSRLALESVKNTEAISHLATIDEFNDLKVGMGTGFDKAMVILERLDQERHFTFEAVKRLESDLW